MMSIDDAVRERHSVRRYTEKDVETDKIAEIEKKITEVNRVGGLKFELHRGEPNPFTGDHRMINVKNYIALFGEMSGDLNEKAGYYGEQIILLAQQLGLNSCWIGNLPIMEKTIATLKSKYKLAAIIVFGYGEDDGKQHESKPMEQLCDVKGEMPDWFRRGMEYAMLAPSAMNQQKYRFSLDGNRVSATYDQGPYTQVDLGIAKYHFELGAGKENFEWA